MLPWQRRVRDHKRQLQAKALLGALAVYALIFFCCLFTVYSPKKTIYLNVYHPGAGNPSPVLFMHAPKKRGKSAALPAQKKQPAAQKNVQKKEAKVKQKPKPDPQPPVKKLPVSRQKESVKPAIKEPVKKAEIKKPEEKKTTPKKNVEKKAEVKKPETQKIEEKKIVDTKVEPNKGSEKKEEIKAPDKPVQELHVAHSDLEGSANYDVAGEASGKVSAEAKAQIALSRALSRAWKPPHGLHDELSLQLIVEVSAEGKAQEVVVEKKSGILAYDMSAKAALWRVEYPREFWGTKISIRFGSPVGSSAR